MNEAVHSTAIYRMAEPHIVESTDVHQMDMKNLQTVLSFTSKLPSTSTQSTISDSPDSLSVESSLQILFEEHSNLLQQFISRCNSSKCWDLWKLWFDVHFDVLLHLSTLHVTSMNTEWIRISINTCCNTIKLLLTNYYDVKPSRMCCIKYIEVLKSHLSDDDVNRCKLFELEWIAVLPECIILMTEFLNECIGQSMRVSSSYEMKSNNVKHQWSRLKEFVTLFFITRGVTHRYIECLSLNEIQLNRINNRTSNTSMLEPHKLQCRLRYVEEQPSPLYAAATSVDVASLINVVSGDLCIEWRHQRESEEFCIFTYNCKTCITQQIDEDDTSHSDEGVVMSALKLLAAFGETVFIHLLVMLFSIGSSVKEPLFSLEESIEFTGRKWWIEEVVREAKLLQAELLPMISEMHASPLSSAFDEDSTRGSSQSGVDVEDDALHSFAMFLQHRHLCISSFLNKLLTLAAIPQSGHLLDMRSIKQLNELKFEGMQSEALHQASILRDALSGRLRLLNGLPHERLSTKRVEDPKASVYGILTVNANEYAEEMAFFVLRGIHQILQLSTEASLHHCMGYYLPAVIRILDLSNAQLRFVGCCVMKRVATIGSFEELSNFSLPIIQTLKNLFPLSNEADILLNEYLVAYVTYYCKVYPLGTEAEFLEGVEYIIDTSMLQLTNKSEYLMGLIRGSRELIAHAQQSINLTLENWMNLLFQSMETTSAALTLEGLKTIDLLYTTVPERMQIYAFDIFYRLLCVHTTFVSSSKEREILTDEVLTSNQTDVQPNTFCSPVAQAMLQIELNELEELKSQTCVYIERILKQLMLLLTSAQYTELLQHLDMTVLSPLEANISDTPSSTDRMSCIRNLSAAAIQQFRNKVMLYSMHT